MSKSKVADWGGFQLRQLKRGLSGELILNESRFYGRMEIAIFFSGWTRMRAWDRAGHVAPAASWTSFAGGDKDPRRGRKLDPRR
jgi:hypothetical protein